MECFLQNKTRIVSIDATGNVVNSKSGKIFQNLPENTALANKRQFYYTAVYRSELSQEIVPIFQFIASDHDVASLSSIFNIFARKLRLFASKESPIDVIVVDFSFSLMNSVSVAFNGCSLPIYLDYAHRKFALNLEILIELTIIASCSTHIIKFFSDKLKGMNVTAKDIILVNFARIIMADSYAKFLDIFSDLYIVLKSPTIDSTILCKLEPSNRKVIF